MHNRSQFPMVCAVLILALCVLDGRREAVAGTTGNFTSQSGRYLTVSLGTQKAGGSGDTLVMVDTNEHTLMAYQYRKALVPMAFRSYDWDLRLDEFPSAEFPLKGRSPSSWEVRKACEDHYKKSGEDMKQKMEKKPPSEGMTTLLAMKSPSGDDQLIWIIDYKHNTLLVYEMEQGSIQLRGVRPFDEDAQVVKERLGTGENSYYGDFKNQSGKEMPVSAIRKSVEKMKEKDKENGNAPKQ